MALQLRAKGIKRVRPLQGGYFGWKEKGYPLVEMDFGQPAEATTTQPDAGSAPALR